MGTHRSLDIRPGRSGPRRWRGVIVAGHDHHVDDDVDDLDDHLDLDDDHHDSADHATAPTDPSSYSGPDGRPSGLGSPRAANAGHPGAHSAACDGNAIDAASDHTCADRPGSHDTRNGRHRSLTGGASTTQRLKFSQYRLGVGPRCP